MLRGWFAAGSPDYRLSPGVHLNKDPCVRNILVHADMIDPGETRAAIIISINAEMLDALLFNLKIYFQ